MASKAAKKVNDVEMKDESEKPEATDEKTATGKKESDLITLEGESSVLNFKNTFMKCEMSRYMVIYLNNIFQLVC